MEKTFKNSRENIYPQKVYASQLITIDDLNEFKKELLDELLAAFKTQINIIPKKWLKSHEVRRFLKISPGTLQTLKATGIIPYTKIGGVHFYEYQDIEKVLQSGKIGGNKMYLR